MLGGSFASADNTFGLNITDGLSSTTSVKVADQGDWILSGVSTFTGDLTLRNTAEAIIGGSGQLGAGNYAGNVVMVNSSKFTYDSSADQVISGVISGINTSNQVRHDGTGDLTLTGTNTYIGATTIAGGGTLYINGDNSGATGAVDVKFGSTLGGTGTVGGATTIDSTSFLSPGDGGIGTLTFSSIVDVSSAGANSMLFDLASPGFSDLVSMSSSELDIGSGSFDLDAFTFTDLSGPGSRIGVGTYTLFDADSLALGNSLGSTVFTESLLGYATATLFESGGDIFLSVTAVPEPSSTALLGLGGLALMLRRKRSAA